MDKEQISKLIQEQGLIPIFSHSDFDTCKNVMMACYRAGIRVFEFTNRGTFNHELFAQLSNWAKTNAPELILAAGSIVDPKTTQLYLKSGAQLIVSPLLNEEVATVCQQESTSWIPGCATLTEIAQATKLGAHIVKVFPGNVLGPEFIKAVKAPCPWFSLMPTGGVSTDKENLSAWFESGAVAVGMGSQLISKSCIAQNDFEQIEQTVKQVLNTIAEIRSK